MTPTHAFRSTITFVALGLAVLPAAAGGARSSRQGSKPAAGAVASVTVTGCLERWSAAQPGGASTSPAERPPAGVEYVVTAPDQDATAAGARGSSKPAAKQYLLLENPKVDYAAHLRHTVTVVGTITPQPEPGASAEDRLIDPSTRETNLPQGPEPKAYQLNLVEVSSVKMVSADCRP